MKSAFAATLLASVALVRAASLFPTGVSDSCSQFFTTLDNDSSLATCTSSLITATGAFAPSTNSSAAAPTADDVKTALSSVCSSSSSCSDTTIRTTLANFYTACTAELTSSLNADVLRTYDILYSLTPFKNSVCAKDDSGNYCISSIASTTGKSASALTSLTSSVVQTVSSSKARRADAQAVVAVIPNPTTITSNNVLFMMFDPSMEKDKLCQSCARTALTNFISYESKTPYAPGLANSAFISGQAKLYQAVNSTCGASFLSGSVAAAAGISSGILGDDSGASAMFAESGVVGVLAGALALAFGAAF
ncbi:uncharacterized protein BXZ73DRAFT_47150 [Epithele typhae]|uniref:uncharacterized protein n=1 Tax=Epithele typhae TaxID=378194 RepID=UPI0020083A0A|nr:uncharacterized protein BXZ73DRAFT_47150 [Epithele typhae]KAH9931619.1 hypothetical protein BXZ73DRAFT_47150 [Epithele typhae]